MNLLIFGVDKELQIMFGFVNVEEIKSPTTGFKFVFYYIYSQNKYHAIFLEATLVRWDYMVTMLIFFQEIRDPKQTTTYPPKGATLRHPWKNDSNPGNIEDRCTLNIWMFHCYGLKRLVILMM